MLEILAASPKQIWTKIDLISAVVVLVIQDFSLCALLASALSRGYQASTF